MNGSSLSVDLHETTFWGNPGGQNTLQWINIFDSFRKLCPSQTGLNWTLNSLIAEPVLVSPSSAARPPSQAMVSVTLLTSPPRSGHLTTSVEMRKQRPSCLSNKGISPLHRWGLLMRDKDDCLSALPSSQQQRKHHSGKSVLHSDCSLQSGQHTAQNTLHITTVSLPYE